MFEWKELALTFMIAVMITGCTITKETQSLIGDLAEEVVEDVLEDMAEDLVDG